MNLIIKNPLISLFFCRKHKNVNLLKGRRTFEFIETIKNIAFFKEPNYKLQITCNYYYFLFLFGIKYIFLAMLSKKLKVALQN